MKVRVAACLLVSLSVLGASAPARGASAMEASRDLTQGARAPRPGQILIYNFDTSPERIDIRLTGLNAATLDTSTPEQRAHAGRRAANYLADALWKSLQARGAPAQRASRETVAPDDALVVTGHVLSLDEGERARGEASPVAAMPIRVRVQFDARRGPPDARRLHWQGRVATTSDPLGSSGLAEAAERLTGMALPGARTASGEGDPVVRYAAEMAEVIAGDLWARFVEQGWVAE